MNSLRLVFALMVVVSHSYPLGFGRPDPRTPSDSLGGIAVTGFFLLSGFLIAGSWKRTQSLSRFTWHRFLRIMPGLWVCLLVTAFLIGPLIAITDGRSLHKYFGTVHGGPWTYPLSNAAVAVRQIGLSGLLTDVPHPNTINGSLWTLFWECLCYALIAALGVAGLLGSRRILLTLTAATWLVCIAAVTDPAMFPMSGSIYGPGTGALLVLPFLVGASLEHFAHRIPLKGAFALAALLGAGAGWFLQGTLGAVLLPVTLAATAYLYFWVSIRARRIRIGARRDLSYGVYIYAFPLQQLLSSAGLPRFGLGLFIAASALLTLAVAYGSWTLIEARALRQKDARLRWVT